jgi:hypothetical protein
MPSPAFREASFPTKAISNFIYFRKRPVRLQRFGCRERGWGVKLAPGDGIQRGYDLTSAWSQAYTY